MELKHIDNKLILNPPWDISRKNHIEYHRIRTGLQKYGQIQPIHVRQIVIDETIRFEVIDGRGVLAAINDLGISPVLCLDHGLISEQQAEAIYLQLKFATRTVHPLRLAELIYKMSESEPVTALQNKLPFDREQIDYYIELHKFDWKEHLLKPKDEKQISLF